MFGVLVLILAAVMEIFAQSSADSLEIYDPFARPTELPRILDEYFSILGEKESALLKKYQQDLVIAEKRNDKQKIKVLLLKLGDLHIRSEDTGPALRHYYRALRNAEKDKDTLMQGILSIRIGRVYAISEILLNTEYTARGVSLLQNNKDPEIQALVLYTRSIIESDVEMSNEHNREALRLQLEVMQYKPNDTTALENLSKYYNGLGYFEEAITAAEKAGSPRLILFYLNNYAVNRQGKGEFVQAQALLYRAIDLAKTERLKGLLSNSYHNLGMLFNQMGQYKNAARYIELHTLVKESLYRENFARYYAENIVQYETEAKERVNAYLKVEKALLEEGLFSARVMGLFLIVGLLILLLLLVISFRRGKKLEAANQLLETQKNQIDSNKRIIEAANNELLESETNLKAAQELALVANWELQMPENRFSFSEMLPKLFGLTKQEIKQDFKIAMLSVIHPDDQRIVRNTFINNVWEPGEFRSSYRILKQGEIRWMAAQYKCIYENETGTTKINGTIQDITLQKEREEAQIRMDAEQLLYLNLVEQQEAERKRIAFEIHDGIGQEMVAMNNQAELALTEKEPEKSSAELLQRFVRRIPELLQELRRISQNLRPVHLERMGLTETIRELARQSEKSSKMLFITDIENIDNLLPVDKELHIYRIVQEVFSNIQKHSGAKKVQTAIHKKEDMIDIRINDDGKGFDVERVKKGGNGFGLHSMEARAKMLGAGYSMTTLGEKGMELHLTIPVDEYGK